MGAFAAGQVIVVPFRFSDLSAQKHRPALTPALFPESRRRMGLEPLAHRLVHTRLPALARCLERRQYIGIETDGGGHLGRRFLWAASF